MSQKDRKSIISSYKKHILEIGKPPISVFKFCQELKLKESTFYKHFASFEALQAQLWVDKVEATLEGLNKDSTYQTYSTREKWLAFLFSFFEQLKSERSLFLTVWPECNSFFNDTSMRNLKKTYLNQVEKWLDEGISEGVIKEGWIPEVFKNETAWWHLVFLIEFWKKDHSSDFERTDIAIEKSVHLLFDAYGNDIAEKVVDFVKFLAPKEANPFDLLNKVLSAVR